MAPIRIGTRMSLDGLLDGPADVSVDDPELRRHIGTPWLSDYLARRHGLFLDAPAQQTLAPFAVNSDDLSMHAVLVGASGSGKTRLALHLLREQLRQGCSAVFMDVKEDTVLQAVQCARDAGFTPDRVSLLWPREKNKGMPEWNFLSGDPDKAVAAFMDSMKSIFGDSWGYRLAHLLEMSTSIAAYRGLSVREVVELLRNADYATALLSDSEGKVPERVWEKYFRPFANDYLARTATARLEHAGPVINKLDPLVGNSWMEALFCAGGDTLDLSGLWKQPRMVAVHLDRAELGQDGTALLATMLTATLYNVALRKPGSVPVVLMLDELDTHERNVGRVLLEVLRRARSQGLRLIAATQTFSSVSPGLVAELLGNTWLRAFFNMGSEDSARIAESLVRGKGARTRRVFLEPASQNGLTEYGEATYPVLSGDLPVGVRPEMWHKLLRYPAKASVRYVLGKSKMNDATVAGMPIEEMMSYVPDSWESFRGPHPLSLVVTFPKPEPKGTERSSEADQASRLSRLIQALPKRRAVVRLRDGTTGLVQVQRTDFSGSLPDPAEWMRSGQPYGMPEETARKRNQRIREMTAVPTAAPVAAQPAPKPASRRVSRAKVPVMNEPIDQPPPLTVQPNTESIPNPFPEMEDDGSI